jgi:cbb3-type cytochrome c oxidase subunit III
MGAPLRKEEAARSTHGRRLLPAAVLLLTFAAGCRGDRSRAATGDTTSAPAVASDTVAMPTADTSAGFARDSARRAAADSTAHPSGTASKAAPKPATTDTGAKHLAKPPVQGKQTAAAGVSKGQATRDTAQVAPRGTRDTSAKAAAPTQAAAQPAESAKTQAASQPQGQTQTADAPLRDAYHQAPRDTVAPAVYDGWKQYNLNCARCHGEDVLGTTIAPHLIVSLKPDGTINTKELFMQTVCAGRPEKGMPAWCALGLDMNKIDDIYLYVKGRSDAKIGPGRPAVKEAG